MNVLKVLVVIVPICSCHVIVLLRITLRHFMWFTKGMFCLCNVWWS